MTRQELADRQHDVLQSLLRREVPEGFDPRSAALTSRVLLVKRRSEAVAAVPAVRDLASSFDSWAASTPRRGCAHDDVLDFVVAHEGPLPEPLASVRAVERVYRRRARFAHDRRPGQRRWVVAVAARVWHVGPRHRAV